MMDKTRNLTDLGENMTTGHPPVAGVRYGEGTGY